MEGGKNAKQLGTNSKHLSKTQKQVRRPSACERGFRIQVFVPISRVSESRFWYRFQFTSRRIRGAALLLSPQERPMGGSVGVWGGWMGVLGGLETPLGPGFDALTELNLT